MIDGSQFFNGFTVVYLASYHLNSYSIITPIKDNLSCSWGNHEVRFINEKVCSVLRHHTLMLHIDVKNYGKFIVYSIPHNSFQSYFLRHHFTILLIEDIILLASHGADDMSFTLQYLLHEGIHPWSNLLPIGE